MDLGLQGKRALVTGSTAGIGFYTRLFAESFSPPDLFALISVLAAIAVTLNELCRIAERHFRRWNEG